MQLSRVLLVFIFFSALQSIASAQIEPKKVVCPASWSPPGTPAGSGCGDFTFVSFAGDLTTGNCNIPGEDGHCWIIQPAYVAFQYTGSLPYTQVGGEWDDPSSPWGFEPCQPGNNWVHIRIEGSVYCPGDGDILNGLPATRLFKINLMTDDDADGNYDVVCVHERRMNCGPCIEVSEE